MCLSKHVGMSERSPIRATKRRIPAETISRYQTKNMMKRYTDNGCLVKSQLFLGIDAAEDLIPKSKFDI